MPIRSGYEPKRQFKLKLRYLKNNNKNHTTCRNGGKQFVYSHTTSITSHLSRWMASNTQLDAKRESLFRAWPATAHLYLTFFFFFYPSLNNPPPDTSHLLITPANLAEVRAQAAKCQLPPPRRLSLSSKAFPNIGQDGESDSPEARGGGQLLSKK